MEATSEEIFTRVFFYRDQGDQIKNVMWIKDFKVLLSLTVYENQNYSKEIYAGFFLSLLLHLNILHEVA